MKAYFIRILRVRAPCSEGRCFPNWPLVISAAKVPKELILLKNSCLIGCPFADSIPLLIGGFGDDGTEAGGASGVVL
jgi:hypothetical protein